MSETNRRNEYNRLIALGRDQDICPALMDEFGPKKVPKVKPVKKKGK